MILSAEDKHGGGSMSVYKNIKKDYLQMIAGSCAMAMGTAWFYEPQGLVTGGVTGLAIIIKHMTGQWIPGGVPLGISTFMLNVPIFIWTYLERGRTFLLRTLISTCSLSLWLMVLPHSVTGGGDVLLSAVVGGILTGVGVGLVLQAKSTTGGADLLAVLLHRRFPGRSVAELIFVLDALVVILGVGVFGPTMALYALIAAFIASKFSDRLTEGVKFAKGAFVITERSEEVSVAVMEQLKRGITRLPVRGMYSGKDLGMLYCVVSRRELVRLKEIVHMVDPAAFLTVTDVREVLGRGWLDYDNH